MLIKYKHAELFTASETEFSLIRSLDDIYSFPEKYKVFGCFGGLEARFALSRILFGDENHIPIQLDKEITGASRVFRYDEEFINTISAFQRGEMDSFAYRLREDEFCKKYGYEGMGIWVFLYELHDCCTLAFGKKNKIYLIEENDEYVLER